ncbi:hypothetical protein [Pedobacter nototheniae]|uniref:hypothetical protein n=1 Tax=Pedobacter nototheniae TaxID=2488994 RepID=UPI0029312E46|nr:hypothetical protein [Pedobacter nototheniae]
MKRKQVFIAVGIILLLAMVYWAISYQFGRETDFNKKANVKIADTVSKDSLKAEISIPKPDYKWQPEVKDFSLEDVERLSQSVYDTVSNAAIGDMPGDTIQREFNSLVFFQANTDLYGIAVAENRAPFYGASVGWCDVFVFKKENGNWQRTDFMLNAGGGGMYGNPGEFEKLVLTGDHSVGIVLTGGQEHMGSNYHHDVINLQNGKLSNLVHITTYHNYGEGAGDDFKLVICESNTYSFEPNGKSVYDLKIIKNNCLLEKNVKVAEVTIPYKKGYKIPKQFEFEN